MPVPHCDITVFGSKGHTQQILTGYFLLQKQGFITLKSHIHNLKNHERDPDNPFKDAQEYHIQVLVNQSLTLYYDMHDSYEINLKALKNSDIYFKRSYLSSYIEKIKKTLSTPIIPLGFNYWVYPNSIDKENIKRTLFISNITLKERAGMLLRALSFPSSISNAPKLKEIECTLPTEEYKNRKILFMVRAWDPALFPNISQEATEQLEEINQTRASCIRVLKKEFKKDFYGGFSSTPYTQKYYKDAIVPNPASTTKSNYLKQLQSYPICIATTGLHNSIGWKFGEYVAMSKAIISEKLIYTPPKAFQINQNFLEFQSPDECIEKTLLLYQNEDIRYQMRLNNAYYYHHYLKPDNLVYNTLMNALSLNIGSYL